MSFLWLLIRRWWDASRPWPEQHYGHPRPVLIRDGAIESRIYEDHAEQARRVWWRTYEMNLLDQAKQGD